MMTWTMMMSEAKKLFQTRIEEALQDYLTSTREDNEVVADWVVVYSRQKIDEEGDVVWANALIAKRSANPNGHIGLLQWGSDIFASDMLEGIELDDDE